MTYWCRCGHVRGHHFGGACAHVGCGCPCFRPMEDHGVRADELRSLEVDFSQIEVRVANMLALVEVNTDEKGA